LNYNSAFSGTHGLSPRFVQSNHSHSRKNVLRGLHYQDRATAGKLVRVVAGAVFDVAVICAGARRPSASGWALCSAENGASPGSEGFARTDFSFCRFADFLYETSDYYAAARALRAWAIPRSASVAADR
jgi:dTDP-4-dehydrorhamnose 3,5-epimerase